jgi:krueppel-like factor 15
MQHTTDNPERFECTVEGCEMTFPSMGNMTRHVKKVHEGERPYACTWEGCDMFPSSTDRNKHIDSVHLGIKPLNVNTKAVAQHSQKKEISKTHTVHENIKDLFVHGMGVLNVSRKNNLTEHINAEHLKMPSSVLTKDVVVFPYSGSLFKHMTGVHQGRRHTSAKPNCGHDQDLLEKHMD